MPKLSAVITTFNNASTLRRCLQSLQRSGELFVDEVLVLDSGSSDQTVQIARQFGARIETQPFVDYGSQKQQAINLACHDWILLLDADEWLAESLQLSIAQWRSHGNGGVIAYRLKRQEWILWRWQHRWSKAVSPIRLFNRQHARMNKVPVHAAITAQGSTATMQGYLRHTGEASLHRKVDKINAYSSGQAKWRQTRGLLRFRMLVYPLFAFWREYLLRRQFLHGWAGFMAAKSASFYAFLKYAKAFEAQKNKAGNPDQLE